MRGEDKSLADILDNRSTRFKVPVYQRNYDWKTEQCKRLFDDLETVIRDRQTQHFHFFGSIVLKPEYSELLIIDGQQRITTVFLLLSALASQVEKGTIASEKPHFVDDLRRDFLIDKRHSNDVKLKLKLIKYDYIAFQRIFSDDEEEFISESNVTKNYRYLIQRLKATKYSADQILEAIEKLRVIDVELDKDDNAQLIFESLNSTGLDLTEGDKIRNSILMDLDSNLQDEYYERYWNRIEENTNYEVSEFVRFWLAAKMQKTPKINCVYGTFRDYRNSDTQNTRDMLEDMRRYSNYYKTIQNADTGNYTLDRRLKRLKLLNMMVLTPFLLELFEYRHQGAISDETVEDVLHIIEAYLFRRWVVGVPTNSLNKIFERLHTEILDQVRDGGDYRDVLVYVLLKKKESGRFPKDQEFLQSMAEKDFYHIGKNKFYLFDCLENGNSREHDDVVGGLKSGNYSIEHIMPQTLSRSWKNDLGPDYSEIHNRWINKLANLTLTGYNSQYSNKSFKEKRDGDDGFVKTGFRMNNWVKLQNEWTEKEMQAREERLKADFLDLWPLPTTSFVPKKKPENLVGLDASEKLTNRKISAYIFQEAHYKASTWADMILGVLSLIAEQDPIVFEGYVRGEEHYSRYFSDAPGDDYQEIADGIYFNTHSATDTKCSILRNIMSKSGIELTDLLFELKAED